MVLLPFCFLQRSAKACHLRSQSSCCELRVIRPNCPGRTHPDRYRRNDAPALAGWVRLFEDLLRSCSRYTVTYGEGS